MSKTNIACGRMYIGSNMEDKPRRPKTLAIDHFMSQQSQLTVGPLFTVYTHTGQRGLGDKYEGVT